MTINAAAAKRIFIVACIISCVSAAALAQTDTTVNQRHSITDVSSKAISGLQKQYGNLQARLSKQSAKLLSRMQSRENKLRRKLARTDTTKAQQVFTDDVQQQYASLQTKLADTTSALKRFPLKEYVPGLDSMQTSLNFLLKNKNLPTDKLQQLQELSTKLKGLEGQLQKANDIQSFVREREADLRNQLLNTGLGKQLTGINKQVYYYQAQLSQYKEMLNNKEKLKEKILETVRSLPAFQKFWQKNSYLAALFPMPANLGTPQALAGLQTRASIQNLVAQRVGTGGGAGVNPQQYFQGQVDAAQGELSKLKDKLSQLGTNSGSSDMTMPDFKPNEQKAKSFLKRLEYGFNIQNESSHYYLPVMSDFALTIGYKMSDTKRFGFGASYKMGWGSSLKNIHLSSQGIGLRSYVDIKSPIKSKGIFFSGLWVSGGFEYNYLSTFRNLQELKNNIDIWQRSALFGLSKKYKIGKKKEGNMQLLYDFLHNRETPPSQAIKFRIGYTF